MTRSSVAMRTPETIACFTRPQLSGISVKLVQCDQIYESPTLNKTLGTYLNGYNNHRHMLRNLYSKVVSRADKMAQHSVVLGAIARTPASKTSLWLQGIPITLRIDAHRKGYPMHNVISSSIHSATTKNIVRFVLNRCIFLRTPLQAVRFKPMY